MGISKLRREVGELMAIHIKVKPDLSEFRRATDIEIRDVLMASVDDFYGQYLEHDMALMVAALQKSFTVLPK